MEATPLIEDTRSKWLWRAVYLLTILAFFLPPYTSKGLISGPESVGFFSEALLVNYAPPSWLGPIFQGHSYSRFS